MLNDLDYHESDNPRAYLTYHANMGEVYKSGWIEPNGDLVIQYSYDGVRRLCMMFVNAKRLLEEKNTDAELALIKDDVEFCLENLKYLLASVYTQQGVKPT